MTPQAAQVYKDIFGTEAPWMQGTPEERERAWQAFLAASEAAEIPDADFEQFQQRLQLNRRDKPFVGAGEDADAA